MKHKKNIIISLIVSSIILLNLTTLSADEFNEITQEDNGSEQVTVSPEEELSNKENDSDVEELVESENKEEVVQENQEQVDSKQDTDATLKDDVFPKEQLNDDHENDVKSSEKKRAAQLELVFTEDSLGNKVLSEIKNLDGGVVDVLEIPDTYEGKNVVGVEASALSGVTSINMLIMPSITVPYGVFNKKGIKNLKIKKSAHSKGVLENQSFTDNPYESISLEGVESIGDYAFWYNLGGTHNVEYVEIDDALTGFNGADIFHDLLIKSVTIPSVDIVDGIFGGRGIEHLEIYKSGKGTGKIEKSGFINNPLKTISISGMTLIDENAFWFTESPKNIVELLEIDNTLEGFGEGNIFPENIIKTLKIPSIDIREGVFGHLGIENLEIFSSDKGTGKLAENSFINNPLKTVSISGITHIGNDSFWYWGADENIIDTLSIGEEFVAFGDGNIFPNNVIKKLQFPSINIRAGVFGDVGLEYLKIIPSSHSNGKIQDFAFTANPLKVIDVSGISDIGDNAFSFKEN